MRSEGIEPLAQIVSFLCVLIVSEDIIILRTKESYFISSFHRRRRGFDIFVF